MHVFITSAFSGPFFPFAFLWSFPCTTRRRLCRCCLFSRSLSPHHKDSIRIHLACSVCLTTTTAPEAPLHALVPGSNSPLADGKPTRTHHAVYTQHVIYPAILTHFCLRGFSPGVCSFGLISGTRVSTFCPFNVYSESLHMFYYIFQCKRVS